jgi:hypothetical protein
MALLVLTGRLFFNDSPFGLMIAGTFGRGTVRFLPEPTKQDEIVKDNPSYH